MYAVTLLNQSTYGATHRDDIIIGMGREHQHTLWERMGTLWSVGIVSIRFAARPSCDGMLQVVEHPDVDKSCRTILFQDML